MSAGRSVPIRIRGVVVRTMEIGETSGAAPFSTSRSERDRGVGGTLLRRGGGVIGGSTGGCSVLVGV